MAIPKIIHQVCFRPAFSAKSALPEILLKNIDDIKRPNSDWEHRLYDDDDAEAFISENYGTNILDNFRAINPLYGAARADFFRYLLLQKVGGVYLDIKSTVTKKLNDVLLEEDKYILSNWANGEGELYEGYGKYSELPARGEYQVWHIISVPQHPFLQKVIAAVSRNIEAYHPLRTGVGHLGVMRTTGPIAYTLAILPILESHPFRLVDVVDLGFKPSIVADRSDTRAHKRLYSGKHYDHLRAPVIVREFRDVSGNVIDLSKMIRNALCPCGSGAKLKHCHAMLS